MPGELCIEGEIGNETHITHRPTILTEEERRERKRQRDRERHAQNAEKVKQQRRERHAQNPEKAAVIHARRRARKAAAPRNDLTAAQWEAIKQHYGYRCAYCDNKVPITMDHIQALAKGGAHTYSNVIPACKSCNSRKGVGDVLRPVQPLLTPLTRDHLKTSAQGRVRTENTGVPARRKRNAKKGTGAVLCPAQLLLIL